MFSIDNIRLIEIELHSYCNRKCSWCPNSFIDRTFKTELPSNLFEKLINELSMINYSKYISFSRYNEPLSDKQLLNDRLAYIRQKLPNVTTVANTNGDYGFNGVDIDELTVMDYDAVVSLSKLDIVEGDNKKIIFTRLSNINNRGGALIIQKEYKRTIPCYEPEYFIGIDYNGDVTPCCNIRHDILEHKPYILGNIKDNTLEEILNGSKAVEFRKRAQDINNLPEPCKTCSKLPGRYTRNNPGIKK